jgi:uncharacterized DUF497 family protein
LQELSRAIGFDWDEWNAPKIREKHAVSQAECEQVFFNEPLVVGEDLTHSESESRYYGLGTTDKEREHFLVFTLREERIRVITARDMSRKERRIYRDVKEKGDT